MQKFKQLSLNQTFQGLEAGSSFEVLSDSSERELEVEPINKENQLKLIIINNH